MENLGNVNVNSLVSIPFSTNWGTGVRKNFDTAIEVADFKIYKGNSTTERASQAGYTISEGFDSLTGIHYFSADISDNTDAGFFEEFEDYFVVTYPDEVLDGVAVSKVIGKFRIETNMQGYVDGFVYFDSTVSNTLTRLGRDGTLKNPVSTSEKALQLAGALGIKKIKFKGTLAPLTTENFSGLTLEGYGTEQSTLTFPVLTADFTDTIVRNCTSNMMVINGDGIRFENVQPSTGPVLSDVGATTYFDNCPMLNDGHLYGTTIMDRCVVKGGEIASLIQKDASASFNISRSVGEFSIEEFTDSTDNYIHLMGGKVTVGSGCTAGTVYLSGWGTLVNNTGGMTVNTDEWQEMPGHSAADVWAVATRALTDKAGFSLAATGLDLILVTSTFVAALIKGVWDRVLTGATHNITNSAGKRLRQVEGALVFTSGTATAGGVNSLNAEVAIVFNNQFVGAKVLITAGAGAGQEFIIVRSAITTDLVEFSPESNVALDNTSEYEIIPAMSHAETTKQGHTDNAIIIDTLNGNAGDIPDYNGTEENPVDNIADATLIAAAILPVPSKHFIQRKGSSITLIQTYVAFIFNGAGGTVALGGQDVSLCTFFSQNISGIGIGTGRVFVRDSLLTNVSLNDGAFNDCAISGTFTITDIGLYSFINCWPQDSSVGATFDMGAAVASTNLELLNYNGPVTIKNLGQSGTDTLYITGRGQITLDVSCIGGTLIYAGDFDLVNNGTTSAITEVDPSFGSALEAYPEGGIFYDSTATPNTNTVLGTDGTSANPVTSKAAASTLALSLGTRKIFVVQGDFASLGANMTNMIIEGLTPGASFTGNSTYDLSFMRISKLDVDVDGSASFAGLEDTVFDDCVLANGAVGSGPYNYSINNSSVKGTFSPSGTVNMYNSHTPDNSILTFDADLTSAKLVAIRHVGDITMENENDSTTHEVHMQGGVVTLDATNTSGGIILTGWGTLVDNSGGGFSVDITGWQELPDGGDATLVNQTTMLSNQTAIAAQNTAIKAVVDAIQVITDKLPIKRQVAVADFYFVLFDTTGAAVTGLAATPTVQVSKDGAAFGTVVGPVSEIGLGLYRTALTGGVAGDTDFKNGTFTFAGAGAVTTFKEVITESA